MAKIVDITDKLTFGEKPRLVIRGVELEVNNAADNVLQVLQKVGEGTSNRDLLELAGMVFTPDSQKKLEELHLNFNDFSIVLNAAMTLMTDTGAAQEGNAEDPTMT